VEWGAKSEERNNQQDGVEVSSSRVQPDTREPTQGESTTSTNDESTANNAEEFDVSPISALLLSGLPICSPTTASASKDKTDDSTEVAWGVRPEASSSNEDEDEDGAPVQTVSSTNQVDTTDLPLKESATSKGPFYAPSLASIATIQAKMMRRIASEGLEDTADLGPNTYRELTVTPTVQNADGQESDVSHFGFEAAADSSDEDSQNHCVVVTHPLQTKLPVPRERIISPRAPKEERIKSEMIAPLPSLQEESLNSSLSAVSSSGVEAQNVASPDLTPRTDMIGDAGVLPKVETIEVPGKELSASMSELDVVHEDEEDAGHEDEEDVAVVADVENVDEEDVADVEEEQKEQEEQEGVFDANDQSTVGIYRKWLREQGAEDSDRDEAEREEESTITSMSWEHNRTARAAPKLEARLMMCPMDMLDEDDESDVDYQFYSGSFSSDTDEFSEGTSAFDDLTEATISSAGYDLLDRRADSLLAEWRRRHKNQYSLRS